MNNKLIFGVIVILLGAAGVVIYNNLWLDADNKAITSVSFVCDGGTDFVAEFNKEFDQVSIIENGEIERVLDRVADAAIRFANDDRIYTFAGESVKVTDQNTGFQTVCEQRVDADNPPYNFGNAGEGTEKDRELVEAVNLDILGVWESTDDEKFRREFRPDGTVVDRYVGSDDVTGIWKVYTANTFPDSTNFPLEPDTVYLRITTGEGQNEMLHFKLMEVTPEELEMVYLDRGGVLKFKMVEQVGS